MKIYIGPYTDTQHWTTHRIDDFWYAMRYGKNSFDKEDPMYEKFSWFLQSLLNSTVNRIKDNKDRKVKVKIHSYDIWGVDDTLALVILPLLKEFKAKMHGAPFVCDEDVPEHLRKAAAPPVENEWDTDDNFFLRWEWIVDEMIFAFKSIVDDDWEEKFHHGEIKSKFVPVDSEYNEVPEEEAKTFLWEKCDDDTHWFDKDGHKVYNDRINNGFRLFGVYFGSLWI